MDQRRAPIVKKIENRVGMKSKSVRARKVLKRTLKKPIIIYSEV